MSVLIGKRFKEISNSPDFEPRFILFLLSSYYSPSTSKETIVEEPEVRLSSASFKPLIYKNVTSFPFLDGEPMGVGIKVIWQVIQL